MSKKVSHTSPVEQAPDAATAPDRSKATIVLAVVAIFLGFVVLKLVLDTGATGVSSTSEGAEGGASITSVRNDAVADYAAAVASGKPIYVLFHSLTCEPCVEISEVVDQVMPSYEDDVIFVNVIMDDPSGQQLAADFAFQYIPTSFFLAPGGETVVDSYTGAMDATAMRAYLEALTAAR